MKRGDPVFVRRWKRPGRPAAGEQSFEIEGRVVKSRGWFIVVKVGDESIRVSRKTVRPA
jgi:hypothetical protein